MTLDGGWGVDALLGRQTRSHTDVDIVIAYNDVRQLKTLLEARGYRVEPDPEARAYNFLMGDSVGHYVDVHTYTFDPVNHPEFGIDYPIESLNGTGSINGYPVRCISLNYMVQFHTGYKVDETDYHDVKTLCQQFGIALPAEYEIFEK